MNRYLAALSRCFCFLPDTWKKQPGNVLAALFFLLIVVWLGWNAINFYSHQRAYTDAGVFQAVANHIAQGKTLYAEVWDHKPPVIYYLNWIPLFFGEGSLHSLRMMERGWIVCGMLAFYFTALLLTQKPLIALLFSLVFHYHFFSPELFQGGNLTEEYASFFVLFAMASYLCGKRCSIQVQRVCLGFAGLCFAFAAFTKEPFLLSSVAWFLYTAFEPGRPRKQRACNLAWMAGGFLFVCLGFLLVFWLQGMWDDWLQVIEYNRAYVAFSYQNQPEPTPLFSKIIASCYRYYILQSGVWFGVGCLGVVAVWYYPFIKRYDGLPWVIVSQLLFELFASHLSGFDIGHYYLQFSAAYCLTGLLGTLALLHALPYRKIMEWILPALLLCVFSIVDQSSFALYRYRMGMPYRAAGEGILSQTLKKIKTEGDTLWTNLGEYSKYYAESGLLSPCPHLYTYAHLFIDSGNTTAQQKRDALTACLQSHPPTFMILSGRSLDQLTHVKLFALREWIQSHYQPNYDVTENGALIYIHHPPPDG